MTLPKFEFTDSDYVSYLYPDQEKQNPKLLEFEFTYPFFKDKLFIILYNLSIIPYIILSLYTMIKFQNFILLPIIFIVGCFYQWLPGLYMIGWAAQGFFASPIIGDYWKQYFFIYLFIFIFGAKSIFRKEFYQRSFFCEAANNIINPKIVCSVYSNLGGYVADYHTYLKQNYYFARQDIDKNIFDNYMAVYNEIISLERPSYSYHVILYKKDKSFCTEPYEQYLNLFNKYNAVLNAVVENITLRENIDAKNRDFQRDQQTKYTENNNNNVNNNNNNSDSDIDNLIKMVRTQMFKGCEHNKEMIDENYKKLIKLYHPDSKSGNEDLAKALSIVRDELLKEC